MYTGGLGMESTCASAQPDHVTLCAVPRVVLQEAGRESAVCNGAHFSRQHLSPAPRPGAAPPSGFSGQLGSHSAPFLFPCLPSSTFSGALQPLFLEYSCAPAFPGLPQDTPSPPYQGMYPQVQLPCPIRVHTGSQACCHWSVPPLCTPRVQGRCFWGSSSLNALSFSAPSQPGFD